MSASGEMISQRRGGILRAPDHSRALVGIGLAAAVACALSGAPVAWLVLTGVVLAASRRAGARGTIERLPVAGLLVVAGAGAMALVAGLLGVDVMSSRWLPRLLLAGLSIVLVATAVVQRPVRGRAGTRSWLELGLSGAPAALMVGIGAVLAASPLGARTAWFLSGDHVRHLGLVTRTIDAGGLEYTSQTYPRGWHGMLAVLWASTGSERDPGGLAALLRVQSLTTWLVLALVPLALALTAAAMHRAGGGRPVASGAVGGVAGALVLGPWFFGDYVPRGFETSVLALLVLAAAVLRVTGSRDDRVALVVVAVSGALMAHVWQVLLPAVAALLVVVLLSRWRPRPPARLLLGDLAVLAVAAALAVPGLLGAVRGYGLSAVAVAGDVPRPVLGWLVVVLVSAGVLLIHGPRSALVGCLVGVGTALVAALALAAVAGVGMDSYYPSKTLWTGVALGLPLTTAAGALLLARADARGWLRRPLVVLGGAAGGFLVLLCAATPTVGVAGSWSAADGQVVVDTVTSDTARVADVVWGVGTETDDATSQLLLDFYSATSTTGPLGLAPRAVDEQCALLTAMAKPVVLSLAPRDAVSRRFGCAPGVQVVSP